MHLFALLIATVFSSQFVRTNDIGTIATDAKFSKLELLTELPSIEIDVTVAASNNEYEGLDWEYSVADVVAPVAATVTCASTTACVVDATDATSFKATTANKITLTVSDDTQNAVIATVAIDLEEIATWEAAADDDIKLTGHTLPALTLTADDNDYRGWKDANMVLRISHDGKIAEGAITGNTGVFTTPTIALDDLELNLLSLPETLKLEIVIVPESGGSNTEVVHPLHFDLPIASGLELQFEVTDPETLTTPLEDDTVFTFEQKDTATWAAVKACVTKQITDEPTFTVAAAEENDIWTVELDLAALDPPPNLEEVWFWVEADSTALPVPFRIPLIQIPTGAFAINVETLPYEQLATQSAIWKITNVADPPEESTAWLDTINVKFALAGGNADVTTEATKDSTDPQNIFWKITSVDLINLGVAKTGGTVNVFVSPQKTNQYIATPVPFAVAAELPEEPEIEFDFKPATLTQEEMDAGEIEITAYPEYEGDWAAADLVEAIFSLKDDEEPADDEDGFTLTLAESNDGEYPYVGTADLSKFVVPEGTEEIFVWIRFTTGIESNTPTIEYLEVPFAIEYTPSEEPTAAFKLTPKEIDLKKAGKTVTITVAENEEESNAAWTKEVFVYFSKSDKEAAKASKDMKKTTKAESAATFSYELTLADITPKLKGKETLYVYVRHSVPAEEPEEANAEDGEWIAEPVGIAISAAGRAAPLFSLLAVVLFCLVKLF